MFNGVEQVKVSTANDAEFAGAFSIQRKTTEGWEPVPNETDLSITDGVYLTSLPAYERDGITPITYRFMEELPAGWHKPSDHNPTQDEPEGVMYSAEFTLEEKLGATTAAPYVVQMYNERNGSIELTKEFWQVGSDGQLTKENAQETTFTLYRKTASDNTATLVKSETFTGTVSFTDLERTDGSNTAYLYYLVEEPVSGYKPGTTQNGSGTTNTANEGRTNITVNGDTLSAWGPFDFTSDGDSPAMLSQSITVKNYRQELPVTVYKQDSVTDAFVSGASFQIYKYDESAANKLGDIVINATSITSANGATVYLDVGQKYIVVESTTPDGYNLDKILVDNAETNVIDLTSITTVDGDTSYTTVTVTLKNRPDPKLKVNKTLEGNSKTQTLTGVEFEIYTKSGGTFTRVTDYGGTEATLTSGTAKQLPAGTYYLKEIIPTGNTNYILDPAKFSTLYAGHGVTDADGSFYFGPFVLEEVTADNPLTQRVDITNYSQLGAVQVSKYTKDTTGKETLLSGAGNTVKLSIYEKGEDEPVKELTIGADGTTVFSGLPIYDESGDKITYVIKETQAPEGYTLSDEVLEVTLTPGVTVTTDAGSNELKFVNLPELDFQATKVFYNIWEHQFTQKESLMAGAEIALYKWNEDTGNYDFVEMGTTDQLGAVTFSGLEQSSEYVAVEFDILDLEQYKYLEPINGKDYLVASEDGEAPPQTLTETELAKYYYVTKKALKPDENPKALVTEKLTNVEHWAQLNIEKFVEEDASDPDAPGGIENEKKRPVNNADFKLYMQVLDEGTNGGALSFDKNNLSAYTLIGSYSSGTMYDANGKRLDGWFATNILKVADNVVYWLVEETPGIGAKLDPKNEYILIAREDTGYTNITTASDGRTQCNQVFKYIDDTVTDGHVRNLPVYGEGSARYASVRIAKWAGELDENGQQNYASYKPLGNATFQLWIAHADGTAEELLDTFTTGLDNDLGDGAAQGELTAWASSKVFDFEALMEKYEDRNTQGVAEDIIWEDENGNGYVRVILVETGTPGGYNAPSVSYPMIMFFQAAEDGKYTETFNDAYYVKDANGFELADGEGWPIYPTEETREGTFTPIAGVADVQYRIVNWPVDNFAVTVHKYGYEVNDENLKMTGQELDQYFLVHGGAVPLAGVEMKLQRYSNGTWVDYAYPSYAADGGTTAVFTTDASGSFAFPKGLAVGQYRIIETKGAEGYENIYDGRTALDPTGYYNASAYYFKVIDENVQVSIYNPDKLSISLLKRNVDGTANLSGATFKLNNSNTLSATTGDNGVAAINNIGSGTYVLSETAAPNTYSKAYLEEYLASAYANNKKVKVGDKEYSLANFATGGIWLGFVTEFKDGQMVVADVVDLSDYGVADLTLYIADPALGSIKIVKTDDLDDSKKLEGAEFTVEYKAFTSWNGAETITDNGTGWTTIGGNHKTGIYGSVTVRNLEPGIYRITEVVAPKGYDLTGGPQYVVLTGGMSKTVTMDGTALQEAPADGVTFANPQQVKLTVEKVVKSGDLTVNEEHSFTFNLYKNMTDSTPWKTIELTVEEGAKDGHKVTGSFEGLSQGQTYYLEETGDESFALTGVKVGDNVISPAADTGSKTLYPVSVPDNSATDITVTAENTYLYGEVLILKVDGTNGNPLTGAAFESWLAVKLPDGSITAGMPRPAAEEIGGGEYRLRIPVSEGGDDILIREMNAPAGYVLEYPETTVTVKPGEIEKHGKYSELALNGNREHDDAAMLAELIFPNYPGTVITLTKYGGMKESSNPAPLAGATFTLYQKQADDTWAAVSGLTTGNDGEISFTVKSGESYALAETAVPEGYYGLQGIYAGDTKLNTATGVQGNTLYLVNGGDPVSSGTTLTYQAYNSPHLELEVRKTDALDMTKAPTAIVNVYEVPNDTPTELTMAQVTQLMSSVPKLENVHVDTAASEGGQSFSRTNTETTPALSYTIEGGKTYLIVETDSGYPQVRDNENVVWYSVLSVPAGATGKQVVTLSNINASASVSLNKSTVKTDYESLLSEEALLEYTLTPTVTGGYPLDSFILTDNGLTAYTTVDGEYSQLDFDTYLKDKYSVTQVTVGKATHDTTAYSGKNTDAISATVTFYDFENRKIEEHTVDVSTTGQTVTLSSATQKAKSVTVNYRCESFEKLTEAAQTGGMHYSLGQNFNPGEVKVTIRLGKQDGGSGILPITQVTNSAEVDMYYRPWNTNGVQQASQRVSDTAQASNKFGTLKTAKVSVTKTVDGNAQSVDLDGGVLKYRIKIENAADAGASMINPFLVDLLPQGTVLNGENGNLQITDAPDGISLESRRSETNGGETAFFVFLIGELKPGESVTVQLEVKVTKSAAIYGADIWNNVIVGSRQKGVQTEDNPRATSWKNANDEWPNYLDGALSNVASERVDALRNMLSDMAGFGYISSSARVTWSTSADASLIKTGMGDRTENQGFSSTQLSTVNNNGWMQYQLIFSNVGTTYHLTDVTLLDVLPFEGDKVSTGAERHSAWDMNFDSIISVQKATSGGNSGSSQISYSEISNYKLYCYTQEINSSNINNVYGQAASLKYDTVSLPDGWVEGERTDATAIAVAIEKDGAIALAPGDSYIVQFRMTVGDLSVEDLADRAWTNTVNNFNSDYSYYSEGHIDTAAKAQVLSSNSVSATILPEQVKVGGHVWIDKDADGVWETGESVSALTDNAMVQRLLDNIEIRLFKYSGTSNGASSTVTYNTKSDGSWNTNANFIFDELDPAKRAEGVTDAQLYSGTGGQLNKLNPFFLMGTAPASYLIAATIPENSGVLTEVTSLGKTTGYSRTQAELDAAYAAEKTDNNFGYASERTSVSERFYLHPVDPATWFDNTKDIGLVLQRNLVINKQAADTGDSVEGAEFQVYGPFDTETEALNADLSKLTPVTVKTGADGKANFTKLNWFQFYVIVESKPADGYKLDGAAGSSIDIGLKQYTGDYAGGCPAWLLCVPDDNNLNSTQNVTVTNKRDIQYTLQASKELSGKTLDADEFRFELLNEKMERIQPLASNDAQGKVSFAPISATSVGTFTYYIREVVPATPATGYTYDESLYKAEVTVTWDEDTANFTAAVSYFVQGAGGTWTAAPGGAKFVNEYEPSPTVYAPKVEKTFAAGSQDPAAGDSFRFELAFDTGDKDSVVMPADTTVTVTGKGTASFGEISFKKAGTYTFTIKETVDTTLQGFGYTFDATEWTLTVEVIDTDGVLSVQSHDYKANGKTDSTEQASFENSYTAVEYKYAPAVEKTLTGDTPPEAETFSFTLALASAEPAGGAILPTDTTVNVVGAGTASFEHITFRAAGTYSFTISEVKGNTPGYTYDDSVWTLTVKTKLEGGLLVLDGDPVYKSDKQTAANVNPEAEFVNKFEYFVEFAPAVFKSFSVDSDPRPSAVTFSFTLKPNDNYPGVEMPAGSSASVTGYGKGYFDAIKFTEPGTYLFTITEVNGRASGYSYDTAKWTLSVTVTADAKGQLSVTAVSYSKQGSNIVLADYASFVNSFDKEKVPKTGDSSSLPGYTAALLGSAGALAILEFIRRKLKKG